MTIYDHCRLVTQLSKDCCNFRVLNTGTNRISLAYQADIELPQYVEGMIEAIREEFREYKGMMERNNI